MSPQSIQTNVAAVARQRYQQALSLLLYQSVFDHEVGQAFVTLLQLISQTADGTTSSGLAWRSQQAYGDWFHKLAKTQLNWRDWLIQQVLWNENPFSQWVQRQPLEKLPPALVKAAAQDLAQLQHLGDCGGDWLSQTVQHLANLPETPIAWETSSQTQDFLHPGDSWPGAIAALADHYRRRGTGYLGQYQAFRWQQGALQGIKSPDLVDLANLVGYDAQKQLLIKNTEFLLAGLPALHVLLYGSRGSGKSSLVKSLLAAYQNRGLRLVEVGKAELIELPAIIEKLRASTLKFIIFVDDLSFEEDNDGFKALKVVLEGGVTAKAPNVVVYATSNRRHLVREWTEERPRPSEQAEVHAWDTFQEKLSFSDRFGLTLTFQPANQETYLKIVRHLAEEAQISLPDAELTQRACQWAGRYNGRSGRTARQFIDFLQSELATTSPSF